LIVLLQYIMNHRTKKAWLAWVACWTVVCLSKTNSQPVDVSTSSPSTAPSSIASDTPLIVVTIDGSIHALVNDGTIAWSIARPQEPLVSSTSSGDVTLQAVPSLTGEVYLTTTTTTNTEKQPSTTTTAHLPQLVARAPFWDPQGRLYTGQRTSSVLGIDIEQGQVLHDASTTTSSSSSLLILGRIQHSVTIGDSTTVTIATLVPAADMVLENQDLLPGHSTESLVPLLTTPGGRIAYQDWTTTTTTLLLPAPVAYAFRNGQVVPVEFVPDTLSHDLYSEYRQQQGDEYETVVCSFQGQVYALQMKSRRPRLTATQELLGAEEEDDDEDDEVTSPDEDTIVPPLVISPHCRPGAKGYPACLLITKDPYLRAIYEAGLQYQQQQQQLEEYYYHHDIGFLLPRPPAWYKILASWLAPTVVALFFLSMEVGRRSRNVQGGAITVSSTVLGYGSHGTVVYQGSLAGRPVAVKRLLQIHHQSAQREIALLMESDGHPNVVRYFLKEDRQEFVYLALELCDMSLAEWAGHLPHPPSLPPTRRLLHQIVSGVQHLHALRIVHRDLKPANILLAKTMKREGTVRELFEANMYTAKISDMGLGKQLTTAASSFGGSLSGTSAVAGPGSVGWQAPEVLQQRSNADVSVRSGEDSGSEGGPTSYRASRSSDVFALGCIFYAVLVPGSHPFGVYYEREANIVHDRWSLDESLSPEARDLVTSMIRRNPAHRPLASQIGQHPFFWDAAQRISFLCEFSDRLETDDETKVLGVEQGASRIVGTAWDAHLHEDLVINVQKYRTYDPASIRDLLRLIRNKHHHFDELSDELKTHVLISKTDGLMEYFDGLFPELLMHCYHMAGELFAGDALLEKYAILVRPAIETNCAEESATSATNVPVIIEEEGCNGHGNHDAGDTGDETRDDDDEEPMTDDDADENADTKPMDVSVADTVDPQTCSPPELDPSKLDMVIWNGSSMAQSIGTRGWNRSDEEWCRRVDASLVRFTPITPKQKQLYQDPKYRTRLCQHWQETQTCIMRERGKCIFAHGPAELRVKDTKRGRWGKLVDKDGNCSNLQASGGEDTYGLAKSIEEQRKADPKPKAKRSRRKPAAPSKK